MGATGPDYKERFLRAMMSLLDMTRGTLWRVKEAVWIRRVPGYVDGGRKLHVGLAVRRNPPTSVSDIFPLLIGTSREYGDPGGRLSVSGCFGPVSKKLTYFRYRPVQSPLADAWDEAEGAMIRRNHFKPRLSPDEAKRLNALLGANPRFG